MEPVKQIVAKNINALRVKNGMTQIELAEKLNYSDKAISKWERAESMPDVAVLVQIAELFDVSMDELTRGIRPAGAGASSSHEKNVRHGLMIGMSLLLVWLIATFIFVILMLTHTAQKYCWLAFFYAVPVSLIVWLVLNSVWFSKRNNFFIISLLMWSLLSAVYLSLLPFGYNIWLIFILGIPGQIIILLWSGLRPRKKRNEKE